MEISLRSSQTNLMIERVSSLAVSFPLARTVKKISSQSSIPLSATQTSTGLATMYAGLKHSVWQLRKMEAVLGKSILRILFWMGRRRTLPLVQVRLNSTAFR